MPDKESYRARYRAEHRAELNAKQAQYAAEHKEEIVAYRARHYLEHREEIRASQAEYYKENKDKAKEYRAKNRDKIKAQWAQYYINHKGEILARMSVYRKTDAGRAANSAGHNNRRTATGSEWVGAKTIVSVKGEYGGLCPYCNQIIVKGHVDHIVPVSKGGTNRRSNLVFSCASCNRQKKNKSLLEFMIYKRSIILGVWI